MNSIAKFGSAGAAFAVLMLTAMPGHARPADTARASVEKTPTVASESVSDSALVKSLPGFRNGYADVHGVRLHYVAGGSGEPLVLLPGWPETWWTFHKVMPALAEHYTVIAVDLRGMGGSSKPAYGYDKKTMARDIHGLVTSLGHDNVNIAGHDIGSAVAFAYAANFPQASS